MSCRHTGQIVMSSATDRQYLSGNRALQKLVPLYPNILLFIGYVKFPQLKIVFTNVCFSTPPQNVRIHKMIGLETWEHGVGQICENRS